MNRYNLQYTIHFPGTSVGFMEFSPNGRFLIVGDGRRDRLYVLDRVTGFRPLVETGTISSPTSLAFENSTSFFVGLSDGRFVEYRVDLRSKYLVKGWTNDALHGSLPATAMTLDATARILALAVGPGVFVFNRVARTGAWMFFGWDIGWKLNPLQVNSSLQQMFPASSTSKGSPVTILPPSHSTCAFLRTLSSLSPFVGKTWCKYTH